MKKYSLIRKTLKFLGWDSETAKTKDVKVMSIEEDATVSYHNTVDSTDFSGNINFVSDENTGIDVDEATDQLSATTGHIVLGVEEITLHTGETYQIVVKNEDGITINTGDVTFSSTNGHASVNASGLISAVDAGSSTIKVVENADANVFSKIKVYVID
jgi:hypothetical protein